MPEHKIIRDCERRLESLEEKVSSLERLANMFYGGFAVCGIGWGIAEIVLRLHGKI